MAIPPQISELIERLNRELDETEQEITEGLNLNRQLLSRFPDNVLLIQFFASLNNTLLFVENSRTIVQTTLQDISAPDATDEDIQDAGESLATRLGRVMEAKISVSRVKVRLENLL